MGSSSECEVPSPLTAPVFLEEKTSQNSPMSPVNENQRSLVEGLNWHGKVANQKVRP